jgi:DNA-binding winged helix-turn-helix (wHTH) protein
MSPRPSRPVYVLGECEVDLDRRELRVNGVLAPLGGRAFEILELLVSSPGQLLSKDKLLKCIWPGAITAENTLHVHICGPM